jgi:hypothetical protein
VLLDRRSGSTSHLAVATGEPALDEHVQDVDDWLTAIAAGRGFGVTAETTVVQYPWPGAAYPRVAGRGPHAGAADLVVRRPAPRRHREAVALLIDLHCGGS